METKPWYTSKTLWLQVFSFVAVLVPATRDFIASNLTEAGGIFAVANFILRLITKKKIQIS